MPFKDRADAGQQLAAQLKKYANQTDVVVLALPRGGVVTGFEVAQALKAPLDIVVPRKIGHPTNPEYAIGAITETGQGIFDQAEKERVDPEWLKQAIATEKKEAERRIQTYRGDKPAIELKNKTVIIVDDGIATGMTIRAAIKTVKERQPDKIVVAVPISPADSIATIEKEVDEVIVLQDSLPFGSIGPNYETFGQTSDKEVVALMKKSQ